MAVQSPSTTIVVLPFSINRKKAGGGDFAMRMISISFAGLLSALMAIPPVQAFTLSQCIINLPPKQTIARKFIVEESRRSFLYGQLAVMIAKRSYKSVSITVAGKDDRPAEESVGNWSVSISAPTGTVRVHAEPGGGVAELEISTECGYEWSAQQVFLEEMSANMVAWGFAEIR